MTTSEPTTGEIERAIDDFNNYVEMGYGQYFRPSSESIELALTALKEKLEREIEELKSEAIVNALENAERIANMTARAESAEQKLELLNGGDFDVIDIPAALAYLESVEEILPHASALIDLIQSLKGTAIELTARAEQAEKERDAANERVTDYELSSRGF